MSYKVESVLGLQGFHKELRLFTNNLKYKSCKHSANHTVNKQREMGCPNPKLTRGLLLQVWKGYWFGFFTDTIVVLSSQYSSIHFTHQYSSLFDQESQSVHHNKALSVTRRRCDALSSPFILVPIAPILTSAIIVHKAFPYDIISHPLGFLKVGKNGSHFLPVSWSTWIIHFVWGKFPRHQS